MTSLVLIAANSDQSRNVVVAFYFKRPLQSVSISDIAIAVHRFSVKLY